MLIGLENLRENCFLVNIIQNRNKIMQDKMKLLVEELKLKWKLQQNAKSGFIFSGSKFAEIIPFFYFAIDSLMELANEFDIPGLMKKTAVMEAINELYNTWINPLLPLYLKPFSSKIQTLVVDTMISSLIDFLVNKVRSVKAV